MNAAIPVAVFQLALVTGLMLYGLGAVRPWRFAVLATCLIGSEVAYLVMT